ncbi:alpha/beta fold hydrolase [Cellulomonas sp. KRMCY2]|uniref:alpha/beta fold hydrolase n=1 Tax=Cellulomonas sp. KRMCY2 TaxID=1304865 RepID=UPI0006876DF5|nr:alpha/beta fold hydrolase [Cellulomonas sp. KRMCY2]
MTSARPAPARRPAPRPARRLAARVGQVARLAALRATFATLDVAAPSTAAARAMRLWCTLPAGSGRRKDLRPGPGEVRLVPVPRGGQVVAESWGDGPVVYLVHGWGGWRGQLGAFVAPLVEAGYRVVGFDAPSHGDSEPGVMGPGRGNAMEFIEALEAVGGEFGPADGVIAHSMGCTTASLAVRSSLPTQRLVLVAPNHDFVEIIADFARTVGFGERTRSLLQRGIEDFCERPIGSFDLVPLGADGAMPQTLVVHDRRDKETPYQVGVDLAAAWPNAALVSTDGLGHQRILTDAGTIALAVGHITDRVGAAPPA